MDVTELKSKDSDLKVQAKEKRQLMANEAAAKEASRLKSQFLANVRSPCATNHAYLVTDDCTDVARDTDADHRRNRNGGTPT